MNQLESNMIKETEIKRGWEKTMPQIENPDDSQDNCGSSGFYVYRNQTPVMIEITTNQPKGVDSHVSKLYHRPASIITTI